jgi:hypothetical protein
MTIPPKLAARLARYGELDQSQNLSPALTLEEFFDGNSDEGSIACNLVPHPGLGVFRSAFESLLQDPSVRDIRFPVLEWIEGLDWPFTDKVIVVTSLSPESIADRIKHLTPDEVGLLDDASIPSFEGLMIPDGLRAVLIWWD